MKLPFRQTARELIFGGNVYPFAPPAKRILVFGKDFRGNQIQQILENGETTDQRFSEVLGFQILKEGT